MNSFFKDQVIEMKLIKEDNKKFNSPEFVLNYFKDKI